jgi:hypothetical protein
MDVEVMQSFTKQELLWIIGELDRSAVRMQNDLDTIKLSAIERGLTQLRKEQLMSISDRLNKVVNDGDKRIAIT